jgi:mRNA interferase RelE/StbE
MTYEIELKPRAVKDLRKIPKDQASRIADALEDLADGMRGDIKRLTNFTPEYRLRVGDYRALFEIEDAAGLWSTVSATGAKRTGYERRDTMVTMHASILKRDGREAFAVLPFEEFVRVREELEEYDDLKALRAARDTGHAVPSTPLREVRRKLRI